MKRAYTLMEVLIVLAILALLFGLVFAGLRHASESAHQAACLSNEHQISAGITLYTQD